MTFLDQRLGSGADPAADRDKRLDDGRGGFVLKARRYKSTDVGFIAKWMRIYDDE